MASCSNCGGAMRVHKDHLVCDYCNSPHFPEPNEDGVRVLGGVAAVACPVCKIELTHATVAGAPVLHCERCRGVLVEMETFVGVVADLRARYEGQGERPRPLDPAELERPVDCPQCRRRMDTHPYGGPGSIVIDNCPRCQLNWLDYRELRRVARAADTGGRELWEMP